MRIGADRDDPLPNDAPPDWLEAARQAFLWRYFYADCGRSDPGNPALAGVAPAGSFLRAMPA